MKIFKNKNAFYAALVFCFLCFSNVFLYAQVDDDNGRVNRDAMLWSTISLEKKITQRLSINIDEELRLLNNFNQINLNYMNFGSYFAIDKRFKVGIVYRWIEKNNFDGSYSHRHRFYVDASYKTKIKFVTFAYRARLQTQVRDYFSSADGRIPESYWRNKFDFKFDINKPITPYIGAEFRYQFPNMRLKEANNEFNRGRYYAGFNYKISDKYSCGAYYLYQREFNINNPERDHVYGIEFGISL